MSLQHQSPEASFMSRNSEERQILPLQCSVLHYNSDEDLFAALQSSSSQEKINMVLPHHHHRSAPPSYSRLEVELNSTDSSSSDAPCPLTIYETMRQQAQKDEDTAKHTIATSSTSSATSEISCIAFSESASALSTETVVVTNFTNTVDDNVDEKVEEKLNSEVGSEDNNGHSVTNNTNTPILTTIVDLGSLTNLQQRDNKSTEQQLEHQNEAVLMREYQRLLVLKKYSLLGCGSDGAVSTSENVQLDSALYRMTRLAKNQFQCPIIAISVVDIQKQHFLFKHDATNLLQDVTSLARKDAFCAHTIQQDDVMVVNDATLDQRFCANPLITGVPGIRFYAGTQILSYSFYVTDLRPRLKSLFLLCTPLYSVQ